MLIDYEIKPVKRKELRELAKYFRFIFGYNESEPVDPVKLLDCLREWDEFNNVRYEIVEDQILGDIPSTCILENNEYIIRIKESVYCDAHKKKQGGARMHIVHEIMHVFLDKNDIKPISKKPTIRKLRPYCSLEWATKAIAGEVMMPFDATIGIPVEKLIEIYGVSLEAAKFRIEHTN